MHLVRFTSARTYTRVSREVCRCWSVVVVSLPLLWNWIRKEKKKIGRSENGCTTRHGARIDSAQPAQQPTTTWSAIQWVGTSYWYQVDTTRKERREEEEEGLFSWFTFYYYSSSSFFFSSSLPRGEWDEGRSRWRWLAGEEYKRTKKN